MRRALPLLLGPALCLTAQETPKTEAAPAPPTTAAPASVTATAPVPAPKPAAPKAPLQDDGLLDPAWFGEDITFTKGDDVDYYWIKPGLNLGGHTVFMKAWEDPAMLRKGRDGKDNAKATELTDSFPGMLRGALTGAFNGKAKVSRSDGDLALVGRFVDANAGSKAAKWLIGLGAGSETATWDLKIVDAKSGEVLMAIHHRAISGTAMSNIQDKLVKWADKFATFVAIQAVK
ncbi:hypothetical protein GETHLI_17110 [Geothrix limicola]|uniref:DUF1795 domain-containing protein n=1 Tax=Geothrix limicola TaxID=2927978 RepID=A0ABQ5QEE2_9BACT|nr:DUF4410 domain-containing protein [Geothrix limicola]GLH73209.1 hypothetical protein GETHLI_17110 [Geothrix limicola]